MLRYLLPFLAVLAACAPTTQPEVAARSKPDLALPPMKAFSAGPGVPTNKNNQQIAQDFLDLVFETETGKPLPVMTRFEGPIRVSLATSAPAVMRRDLSQLIGRLRTEAKIDINLALPGQDAQLFVETVARKEFKNSSPEAACTFEPNVSGWKELRRFRNKHTRQLESSSSRLTGTIFIPAGVSPQEMRDCLHEEIAQGLGPVNDLFRLSDSVFNDNNIHVVLTGFDMLILRAYYDPALQNGMNRKQVAEALPGILNRINPRGIGQGLESATPRRWNNALAIAIAANTSPERRFRAAEKALEDARELGWKDHRLAYSVLVSASQRLSRNPEIGRMTFEEAQYLYDSLDRQSVYSAHVAAQMAGFALAEGEFDRAISITNQAISATRRSENAALLSTFLLFKAEALEASGRLQQARIVRNDALAWARYGFGSDNEVRARQQTIRALVPRKS